MLHLLQYVFVRAVLAALQAIPSRGALHLMRGLSRLFWILDARHRKRTIQHLRLAYPDLSERGAREISLRVFEHMGRHVAYALRSLRGVRFSLRIEGLDRVHQALAQGKGVVMVGAHLGPFILLGQLIRLFNTRVLGIIKPQPNRRIFDWFKQQARHSFGVEFIHKKEARDVVSDHLRQNHIVSFFADQHPRTGGFAATFFSRPITAAAGPTVYARRHGCPLLLVTLTLESDGTPLARVEGPFSTEGTGEEISQRWIGATEARVREHPEQWMWMHRRWRGEPET